MLCIPRPVVYPPLPVGPQTVYSTSFLYRCKVCIPQALCLLQGSSIITISWDSTGFLHASSLLCATRSLPPARSRDTAAAMDDHTLLLSAHSPSSSGCLCSARSSHPTTSLSLMSRPLRSLPGCWLPRSPGSPPEGRLQPRRRVPPDTRVPALPWTARGACVPPHPRLPPGFCIATLPCGPPPLCCLHSSWDAQPRRILLILCVLRDPSFPQPHAHISVSYPLHVFHQIPVFHWLCIYNPLL
ncbi:uncharacterized protein [Castor canadensis]|uniref:Uncharacterized protein n=1 Tax=Castor canadensis TaxID=51338 RepID=A0AC58KU79_CASCN